MSVVVVATIEPLPEHRAEVLAALREGAAAVHAEEGCELYALHEDDSGLVLVEKWRSREDLARHGKGAALAAIRAGLAGKVTPGGMRVLTPVPAGDAGKGVITTET